MSLVFLFTQTLTALAIQAVLRTNILYSLLVKVKSLYLLKKKPLRHKVEWRCSCLILIFVTVEVSGLALPSGNIPSYSKDRMDGPYRGDNNAAGPCHSCDAVTVSGKKCESLVTSTLGQTTSDLRCSPKSGISWWVVAEFCPTVSHVATARFT